jgi:hypothetical protein
MKEPPKIAVIVNPTAHKGGAGGADKPRHVVPLRIRRRDLGRSRRETVGRLPFDVSVLPRAFLVGTVS